MFNSRELKSNKLQLLTMDLLALTPMKNAANCDKQCETQLFVSHPVFERTWQVLGPTSG
jgi:hypothetical protein